MRRLLFLVLCLVAGAVPPCGGAYCQAPRRFPEPTQTETRQLHPAIRLETRTYVQPRPLRLWLAEIDLTADALQLVVTGPADLPPPHETLGETTLAFARRTDTLLAINASVFGPVETLPGRPMSVQGLLLSAGRLVSPPEAGYPALVFTANRRPERLPATATAKQAERYCDGISGFRYVVEAGRNRCRASDPPVLEPRTAAGYSLDRRRLLLLIVDGRQPRVSEGVSEFELGELGLTAGCHELLNLDGGGSTTLVAWNEERKRQEVVNRPVGLRIPGTLRPVGGNFGVRTSP